MRVGIIAEGRADLAVITNILRGRLGLEKADLTYLRPEYDLDETDMHQMAPDQFGGWSLVKRECQDLVKIEAFLNALEEERLIVIQLDTAEAYLSALGIQAPDKDNLVKYSEEMRARVIKVINEWLAHKYLDVVRYAVAIEETDAWVLTLYIDDKKDTSSFRTPKEKLSSVLNKKRKDMKRLSQRKPYDRYHELTLPFRKAKQLDFAAEKNRSLKLFCDSLGHPRP